MSPGAFYGGISVADIQAGNYRSSLRNKLVAEAFYLTGSIEKYGSGFKRTQNKDIERARPCIICWINSQKKR